MLVKPLPLGLASVAYVPRGPLLCWEDEAVAQALLSAMHASARRHRAISLKIEPAVRHSPAMQQRLQSYGFRRSDFNNQPQCTMWIDLTPDTETILANMHKNTRRNIRRSAKRGVVVREATAADLDTFHHLLEVTAKRASFPIRSREYYRQEWNTLAPRGYLKLFLALHEGEVLAVQMTVAFSGKAATFHSGSFDAPAYRKLKPNELLMWQSLKWAKAQGCTTYDVWGIPDEVGEHLSRGQPLPEEQKGGLWGVYHFKRGFGGDVVYYVGAYDFVYSSPLYWLMNTAMTRLGSLEKLAQLGDQLNLRSD
jgi:lipid II:glycine glycyltransferase (peptidoglycan interpeptide bridge formation enzyme)